MVNVSEWLSNTLTHRYKFVKTKRKINTYTDMWLVKPPPPVHNYYYRRFRITVCVRHEKCVTENCREERKKM